jgi:hypothetical protein
VDDFARLPAADRREIIAEVAIGLGVDFTIVEKDFWVCWTLRALFALPAPHAPLVFKGGTSLSKAYGMIQRFSEDIDVVTAVDFYLARGFADPESAPSRTKQLSWMEALDAACTAYVSVDLQAALRDAFANRLGTEDGWQLTVDPGDHQTLLFHYPTSAPDIEHSYIRERVKIELGWRSVTTPVETRVFTPYIADRFPNLMPDPNVTCTVLSPARTFWEKVTALHAESFRDIVPHFYSRHYSDVAAILQTPVGEAASRDLPMLDEVRQYKERYYAAAWARYDQAVPGTLSIVPSETKMRALIADYRDMRMMFFREPPAFESVVDRLRALQEQVNGV